MSSTRRAGRAVVVVAALVVAALGLSTAMAQQDGTAGSDPAALLERLDDLELQLPDDVSEVTAELDEVAGAVDVSGDPASIRARLDTLEPELRRLYVDADEAGGPVGTAVADVARGWLDVWNGASALATAESHDLAFPLDAFDDDGVATGADSLRGVIELGLELIMEGRARHLAGYTALRELGEAPPEAQARLDARAAAAEAFDADVRPVLALIVSASSPTVLVAVERFDTQAPGVESRASAVEIVCVDRDALVAAGGVATPEVIAEILEQTPERADCPGLPEGTVETQ